MHHLFNVTSVEERDIKEESASGTRRVKNIWQRGTKQYERFKQCQITMNHMVLAL